MQVKHLDQKYFTYRTSKVEAAAARYPDRESVLVASEYMRLGFVAIGSLLCTAIFGILAVTAVPRIGWLDVRTSLFMLFALLPAGMTVRSSHSLIVAMKNRMSRNASQR